MGHLWTVQPCGGGWLVANRVLGLSRLALCWAAFMFRETDIGLRLTRIDEAVRLMLIPLLLIAAISSLSGYGPFKGDPGLRWFAAKLGICGLLLIIGLLLCLIMREWTMLFRKLAPGPDAAVEARLEHSIRFGRRLAFGYWIGIASVAFLGATKPFQICFAGSRLWVVEARNQALQFGTTTARAATGCRSSTGDCPSRGSARGCRSRTPMQIIPCTASQH